TYRLTVTDAAGQSAMADIALPAPEPVTATIRLDAPAATNQQDGRATVTARGGTGTFTFAWDTGETTATASRLGGGDHTVTVTDANGCTSVASLTMPEDILPLTATLTETTSIKCAGAAGATLEATVAGGKPPYTFSWPVPGGPAGGQTLANAGPGRYVFEVTDAQGTTASAAIEVREPAPLTLETADITPATTGNADGKVRLRVAGGTLPYVHDGAPLAASARTFQVDRLAPGKHLIRVRDANGCEAETEVMITEN